MKALDRSVYRFPVVGLINTATGLLVIYLFKLLGFDDIQSNLIGYALGITVSFFLNKKWTFSHEGSSLVAALRFLAVTAVAYSANLLVVVFLIDVVEVNGYWAQAAAVPVYALMSYVGYRKFAFPKKQTRMVE